MPGKVVIIKARSYETQVFLASRGINDTRQIQGGYAMILAIDPEFGG